MQESKLRIDPRGWQLVILSGAWLVGILLATVVPFSALSLLIAAAIVCVLSILCWQYVQARLFMILLLCVLLRAWRYKVALPGPGSEPILANINHGAVTLRGAVNDEPKLQGRGVSRVLMVTVNGISMDRGSTWQNTSGKIAVVVRGNTIEDPYGANYGDTVELYGKLQAAPPHSTPDTLASMAFPRLTAQPGSFSLIATIYHWRVGLATLIARILPQPEAALLVAILLGLRTPALQPLIQAFNVTGTAHLIVPSGFKVTILAGLVMVLLKKFYTLPLVSKAGRWQQWGIAVPVVICIAMYTILSGAGSAAIRAGVMGILLVLAPRFGRTYDIFTALALTALLMSVVDPFVLWDVGFQLSFLGTLGIVTLTPYIQRLLAPLARMPGGHVLAESIAVTLAAQTATLPIFAVAFQNISLIAPLANMLTVPLLGVLITLGTVLCISALLIAPLATLWGWLAWPVVWYMEHIIAWCALVPGAYIPVSTLDSRLAWGYYGLLATAFWLLVRKRPLTGLPATEEHKQKGQAASGGVLRLVQAGIATCIVLATVIAIYIAPTSGPFTMTFLAVGPANQPLQGEAILIRTSDKRTILIDGGLDSVSLSQELDSRLAPWQRKLDLVVLTTPLRDHLNGLLDVQNRYQIGSIIDPGMLHPNATYAQWRRNISESNQQYMQVHEGMSMPLGNVALQVLWPLALLHKSTDENRDNGLIVRLVVPGLSILLLNAAAQSRYALAGLLESVNSNYLQAAIVQMVGAPGKTFPIELKEVLQKVHPQLLVVSPAALSAKQRAAGSSTVVVQVPQAEVRGEDWQIIETAQTGTVEIQSQQASWNIASI